MREHLSLRLVSEVNAVEVGGGLERRLVRRTQLRRQPEIEVLVQIHATVECCVGEDPTLQQFIDPYADGLARFVATVGDTSRSSHSCQQSAASRARSAGRPG